MIVYVDDDSVHTLDSLAEELQKKYKWKSYRVKNNRIFFTVEENNKDCECVLNQSGFSYYCKDNKPTYMYDVDWTELIDQSDFIWATDSDGNSVMVVR